MTTATPMQVVLWVVSILGVTVAGAAFLLALIGVGWEHSGAPLYEGWEDLGQLSVACLALIAAGSGVHFASRRATGRVFLFFSLALAITAAWWALGDALAW